MIDNPFYGRSAQGDHSLHDLGDFVLEGGATLRRARLAFRTYGSLNADRSNAVLVTTWFSGTGKDMADLYVGPGRALDPARYFVVIVDQLGSGVSSSPQNTPPPQAMADFPKLSVGDDVRAQRRLLHEAFGIDRLALVVGASMGGMQVYEWAVAYPAAVARAAAIAAPARVSAHQQMFVDTLIDAITSDPQWNGGRYAASSDVRAGLRRMARIVALLGWSTEFHGQERWRNVLGMTSPQDFMDRVMFAYFDPMDANVLLSQMHKWQKADVARHVGGDLAAALARITARMMVMPISHDLFFPLQECAADCTLVPGATLRVIRSPEGHMGLNGYEPGFMRQVDRFLAELLAT
jgi:homoserine O-acetyltransferase/O-succinyltransferase